MFISMHRGRGITHPVFCTSLYYFYAWLLTDQVVLSMYNLLVLGPFTQSVNVSSNANANAKMGTWPIHFAAEALPLTPMQTWRSVWMESFTMQITHLKSDANALCERATMVQTLTVTKFFLPFHSFYPNCDPVLFWTVNFTSLERQLAPMNFPLFWAPRDHLVPCTLQLYFSHFWTPQWWRLNTARQLVSQIPLHVAHCIV